AVDDLESGPMGRDAGVEAEPVTAAVQTEDRLEDGRVEPGGGAGVPSPAAAADVRRAAVDVARDDVRLDLVAVDARGVLGVTDGVEQLQQVDGGAALAQPRGRLDHPGGGVGILAAVLADPWEIALDIAGVHRLIIERRVEQADQPPLAIDEVLVDGLHGPLRTRRLGGPTEDGPG